MQMYETGQLYVVDVGAPQRIVPIDNFVFIGEPDADGVKTCFKLESTSWCTFVSQGHLKDDKFEYEWHTKFVTKPEALRFLASLLESQSSFSAREYPHA